METQLRIKTETILLRCYACTDGKLTVNVIINAQMNLWSEPAIIIT